MNERLFVEKELSQQPCRHECVVFAASKGDLDAFWAARKMRTQPTGAKTSRKK